MAKELRVFKALVNRAVREGHLTASPIEHVEAPRIVDARAPLFYTADELGTLYDACIEPWHAAAWRLLANTGMRRGEALHARREWIQGHLLNIRSTGEERTKSGEWRSIPISDGAREALEQLARLNADSPYILPRIAPPSFSRAAAKCMARAGLSGSLHTLRHTYGSLLVMQGVPIRIVQRYMGHAHVATTEIYLHLAPGFAAEAALRLAV